jgi:hypothetical protein
LQHEAAPIFLKPNPGFMAEAILVKLAMNLVQRSLGWLKSERFQEILGPIYSPQTKNLF